MNFTQGGPAHAAAPRPRRDSAPLAHFVTGTSKEEQGNWSFWARTRLIPSVQEFVRLHAHTTLGIPNALSQFEANNLSHDYSLNLNDIYFTSPLPAYPGIGGIPIPRVEIRIPGIALNTSTVGSDLVRVPAPPPFTGLQKVHPPRRGLMFLPSNSTSGRSIEVRAGPRVFEFYEHSWQHAGGLLNVCPIQCRGQEGTLGNLENGLFSNPFHHQRWTYHEGDSRIDMLTTDPSRRFGIDWTAIDPFGVLPEASWKVKFNEPRIDAVITFHLPFAEFAQPLLQVGIPPWNFQAAAR